MKHITVIGSGYVGTTTAALLAASGHEVTAIDIDQSKVDALNSGKAPFFEHGLDSLVSSAVSNQQLTATNDFDSIAQADIIFSCVGTPDNADGSPNLRFVNTVAEQVAATAKEGAIFVQKSTVPVGTGDRLQLLLTKQHYVSNPEFLREGTAIKDSLQYDRIVVGGNNAEANEQLLAVFDDVLAHANDIATTADIALDNSPTPKKIVTSIASAELIKVTANAFLALKISFANSVAKLADKSGADATQVLEGVGADSRIGSAFLQAGRGYGGGCFPKDVSGLISVAIDHGVDFSIMTAATDLNDSMPGYIVNKVAESTTVKGTTVAVLGLAFKPGTSDTRKSPAVQIANMFAKLGANVKAYDPEANHEAQATLSRTVELLDSKDDAIKDSDIVVIATDWPEFKTLELTTVKQQMSGTLIVDCMNCLDKDTVTKSGLNYIGVGR